MSFRTIESLKNFAYGIAFLIIPNIFDDPIYFFGESFSGDRFPFAGLCIILCVLFIIIGIANLAVNPVILFKEKTSPALVGRIVGNALFLIILLFVTREAVVKFLIDIDMDSDSWYNISSLYYLIRSIAIPTHIISIIFDIVHIASLNNNSYQQLTYCARCGKPQPSSNAFCSKCGNQLSRTSPIVTPANYGNGQYRNNYQTANPHAPTVNQSTIHPGTSLDAVPGEDYTICPSCGRSQFSASNHCKICGAPLVGSSATDRHINRTSPPPTSNPDVSPLNSVDPGTSVTPIPQGLFNVACPSCGAAQPNTATSCGNCGVPFKVTILHGDSTDSADPTPSTNTGASPLSSADLYVSGVTPTPQGLFDVICPICGKKQLNTAPSCQECGVMFNKQ